MRKPHAVLLFLLTAVLAGCGRDGSTPSTPAVPKAAPVKSKGVIGVSVLTTSNPFFKVIGDTITAEAGKQGYEVVVVSGDNDVARQQNQVKDFLVKKVRAIVLCPCDSKAIGPVIAEANAAGVPVFTADVACLAPGTQVVTHVATDNYRGGKEAAGGMIEALGEAGGEIVILDFKQVESCLLRVKGFREVIDEHNRKGGRIKVMAELPGDGQKDRGYKAAEDALQAHPDLAGIFAINDPSALGARAAVEKAGKADRVKIIAFDGQPEGKRAVREGKIYAEPIQFPQKIGAETVKAIVKHFDGEDVAKEILIPTQLYRKADAASDPEAQ